MEEKSKKLKILAIQMSSELGNKEANFLKVSKLIAKNIQQGTDIIVLPEVWTVGWKPSEFEKSAEDIDNSETIKFLSDIAKKYNTNIIGGSFITKGKRERGKGNKLFNFSTLQPFNYFNTCPIINRKGELVATYDKTHLFSYYGCDEGKFVQKGENPIMIDYCINSGEIASLKTSSEAKALTSCNDTIKIGLSICYDIRFPEIYRAYAKAGADILINMAAWPMKRATHWEALSKARAIENQCFMIALTQSGLIEEKEGIWEYNLGHSRIIDFNGEVISEIKNDINGGEGAMIAEIKFEEMYEFRKKCTVLLDICDRYDVK